MLMGIGMRSGIENWVRAQTNARQISQFLLHWRPELFIFLLLMSHYTKPASLFAHVDQLRTFSSDLLGIAPLLPPPVFTSNYPAFMQPYLSIALVNPLFFFAGLREGEKKKASRQLTVQTDGMFQSECVFALKVCVINRCLLFYPAVPRRPSSAARGEVSTMAPPLRDPTPASMASHLPFLLLLLLPPCVLAQSSALPATPNASSADPPPRPAECAKKEHPKVSIQGQNPHPV